MTSSRFRVSRAAFGEVACTSGGRGKTDVCSEYESCTDVNYYFTCIYFVTKVPTLHFAVYTEVSFTVNSLVIFGARGTIF